MIVRWSESQTSLSAVGAGQYESETESGRPYDRQTGTYHWLASYQASVQTVQCVDCITRPEHSVSGRCSKAEARSPHKQSKKI